MNSPFARFQLFRNPFGELTRQERAELAVVDVQPLVEWLTQPADKGQVVQVLGPCGHGKSTHLLALGRALGNCPYVYFPEEGHQPKLPVVRPLLVDEAQRMNWLRRRQLLARSGPLVIGTHVDLAPACTKAGFSVMTIDLDRPLAPQQLQQILNHRILASREGSPAMDWHPLCLSLDQVVVLQERFGSNIRLIEQYLFVAFQRFAEKGEPWLPAS